MKGVILFCALVPTAASAETFHVSTSGNDAAAGTQAAPWRTIQHAADRVAPGDTVVIHAGTYVGFQVNTSGTEAAPIAFVGEGDVQIDGAATADRDAVHVEGASYVRIEGLTVTHATRSGISALNCDHITIRRNKADQNAKWGIFTAFCDDLTIEGNETSRSGSQHGIYASNSADRPIIRGNLVWGNAMCGIHMNGDISEGGDGIISNAIVENNIIRDNGKLGGSGINGDGVQNALIRNNVLDGNHASGISLYQIDGGGPSTGNRVLNNTVRMAADSRWAVNIQDGSTNNILRNNILLDAAPGHGAIDICAACMTGMTSDHNAVVGRFSVDGEVIDLASWRQRTGNDAASFAATDADLFANAAGGDLTLHAGSPAIDAGSTDGAPDVDALGVARPQGTGVDIGAYEFCDGPCAGGMPGGGDGDGGNGGGDMPPGGDGDPGSGDASASSGCATAPGASLLVGVTLLGLTARSRRRRR